MTCIDRWERDPFLPEGYRDFTRRYRATILMNSAWSMVRINADAAWARNAFLRAIRTLPSSIARPRLVMGMLLSFTPAFVRRWLNSLGNRVRNVRSNSVYVEGYR